LSDKKPDLLFCAKETRYDKISTGIPYDSMILQDLKNVIPL
jgi:hypothetical protein